MNEAQQTLQTLVKEINDNDAEARRYYALARHFMMMPELLDYQECLFKAKFYQARAAKWSREARFWRDMLIRYSKRYGDE